MRTTKTLLAASLVFALAAPLALAAKADKNKTDKSAPAKFAAVDKDGDGSISEAEYVAAMKDKLGEDEAKKHFAELDKDHDGKLTRAEFNGRGGGKGAKKKPAAN